MPPALTHALITLHGAGRSDTYGAALLDVAQDHLLWSLDQGGYFNDGSLMFKGGTSLRKCRLGNAGRFSTDLDFVAPDDDTVLNVCEAIHGARVSGFSYSLNSTRGDGRHWDLTVNHAELGNPELGASIEFASRALIIRPEHLKFISSPVHRAYGFELPELPVIAESEACAEKLARYRRTPLGRDVYDLSKFAERPIDEQLVRRIWVLKVWGDVVFDKRGTKPLDPAEILTPRRERDFIPDSIGVLTQPIDIERWERLVRDRFQFLANLDADEKQWAKCDPRDRLAVENAITHGGFASR